MELKPCPFCGGNAHVRRRLPGFQTQCFECGCGTDTRYQTPEYAATAWNRRTPDHIPVLKLAADRFALMWPDREPASDTAWQEAVEAIQKAEGEQS